MGAREAVLRACCCAVMCSRRWPSERPIGECATSCAASSRWWTRPTCLTQDRKSTRLNSSHSQISYAVFCLKKKKTAKTHPLAQRDVSAGLPLSHEPALQSSYGKRYVL